MKNMLAGISNKLKDDLTSELYTTICDILVTAGYFRARLPIEPFEKIIGGMCWAITGANAEVELEYEDDLNLGQKIRLSEKIVQSVENMACPHKLQAH
jgi:hypothetical protein